MPTCKTLCSSCKFFIELYSPILGESWNRCTNKHNYLINGYPCKLNLYGYADKKCCYYKKNNIITCILNKLKKYI